MILWALLILVLIMDFIWLDVTEPVLVLIILILLNASPATPTLRNVLGANRHLYATSANRVI